MAPRFQSFLRQGCCLPGRAGFHGPHPLCLLFQVGEVYQRLYEAMSQPPVKENIPYSWASLACVKAQHYGALAHYFTAILLIDHQCKAAWAGREPGFLPLGGPGLGEVPRLGVDGMGREARLTGWPWQLAHKPGCN